MKGPTCSLNGPVLSGLGQQRSWQCWLSRTRSRASVVSSDKCLSPRHMGMGGSVCRQRQEPEPGSTEVKVSGV